MASLFLTYTRFAFGNPWKALLIMALLTIGFGTQVLNLKVDSTPYFIDNMHPERIEEEVVRKQFTNSKEQAFVLVVAEKGKQDVFNPETLKTVQELTSRFENLALTDEADIARLKSIAVGTEQEQLVDQIIQDGINKRDGESLKKLKALLPTGLPG
jgi:predicted RND superfamily exporter protein